MSEAMTTTGADVGAAVDTLTAFATHPATVATVKAVQSAMPPQSNWADVAVAAMGALAPYLQPILQVTRASDKTSAEVALGYAALSAILQIFHPHPGA